jgi:hypothetical protein
LECFDYPAHDDDVNKIEAAITAIKQARALDKKAENARELGLDYEPVLKDNSNYRYDPPVAEPVAYLCENAVGHKYFRWKKPSSTFKPIALYTTPPAAPVQDLPFGVGGGLVAIKTLLSRDPCVHANTAIEMIDAILKEHPAAQPAPVQEPVAVTYKEVADTMNALWNGTLKQVQIATELANTKLYTTPPAAQRQWVGLTAEEKRQIFEREDYQGWLDYINAIEAALRSKNT